MTTCNRCTMYQAKQYGKGYCNNEANERLYNKQVAINYSCNDAIDKRVYKIVTRETIGAQKYGR